MFLINQIVKMKNTDWRYTVLAHDVDTVDGRQVVLVSPVDDPMNIFPMAADSLEPV